ncbi:MAG: DNA repair exonuclease [Sphingomicrobium sp.]
MRSFRFLHAADIHLDSPLHGLAKYDGLPVDEVRGATRAAFDNLIRLAIDEHVDFVVIAGDLFDGDWKDMGTGLYFARAMGMLDRKRIPAFVLAGNHDAASVITRTVPWPPNVRLFGSRRPETHVLEDIGVAVHGQSFANSAVTDNLVLAYPPAQEAMFNIGVLHTALAGREGHATYAPCDVDDLRAKHYDYWALGHVHGFEIVSTDPHVVFPGNIQGRNVRETGPKGAALVEVVDREVVSVQPVELDVIRWTRLQVDCTDADPDRVRTLVRDALVGVQAQGVAGRPLIVRLVLTGESEHAAEFRNGELALRDDCRALALSVSPDLWLEKLQIRLQERRVETVDDIPSDLAAIIAEAPSDAELAEALREDLAPFISSARASLGDAGDDDVLRGAVESGDWSKVIGEAASGLQPRLSAGA